jgi:DNA-binding CsgD family transcriptional regulator
MNNVRLTDKEKAAILRLYRQGLSFSEIGRRVGRTHDAVRYLAEKEAGYIGRPRRPVTPRDLAEMQRLYYEGLTFKEIGRRVGRHREVVRMHLVQTGDHVVIPQGLSDRDSLKVAQLYRRGVMVDAIADRFGITLPSLYRHLRRHNVSLRRPHASTVAQEGATS